MDNSPIITTLIGFMGCGKSTVGKILSRLCGQDWIDLDDEIVKRTGLNINYIFLSKGESGFRKTEYETLEQVLNSIKEPCILSLGGGTLSYEPSRELVRQKCHCVYLQGSLETLIVNVMENGGAENTRPLIGAIWEAFGEKTARSFGKRLAEEQAKNTEALYEERLPVYEDFSELTVSIDGKTAEEVAEEVFNTASSPFSFSFMSRKRN